MNLELQRLQHLTCEHFRDSQVTFEPKESGAQLGCIAVVNGVKYHVKSHAYGYMFSQFSRGWIPREPEPLEILLYRAFEYAGIGPEVHIIEGRKKIDTFVCTRHTSMIESIEGYPLKIMLVHLLQQIFGLTDFITNVDNYCISNNELVIFDFRIDERLTRVSLNNILEPNKPFYKYGRYLPEYISNIVYTPKREYLDENIPILRKLYEYLKDKQFPKKNVIFANLNEIIFL